MMPRKPILPGTVYGKWTVLGPAMRDTDKDARYDSRCQCVCGNISTVQNGNLRSGMSRGCTECRKPITQPMRKKAPRAYTVWAGRSRWWGYPPEWESFEVFLRDMGGECPAGWRGHRPDLSRRHEPGNFMRRKIGETLNGK